MFGFVGALAGSMRPSSQSVKDEYLAMEFDDAVRNATVSIYSKVVDGLSSIDGSTGGNGSAHHWVLVVHFEDDAYRLLEGNQNEDHFLHAYYRKSRADGMTKLKELGSVRTSPAKLRSIARGNSLNGSCYDLVSNNCQDWACNAAWDISDSIGREAARIPRIAPILNVTRSVLFGPINPAGSFLSGRFSS